MAKLINLHDFAVPVEALGRELAPYEVIVVEDEKIVRDAIAAGVLHSDLEELSEDGKNTLAGLEETASEVAKTWHAEHGGPAVDLIDSPQFISTAQQNHVVGLAKGKAVLAGQGFDVDADVPAPDQLPESEPDPSTVAAKSPIVVERRDGPVGIVATADEPEANPEGDEGATK